jgi:hypothetical protein
MGHQITAMFEWMRHTDNTLNARLREDVFADDVPGEAEVRRINEKRNERTIKLISF